MGVQRKGIKTMNCNVKESLKRQIVKDIAETLDEQRVIWEVLTLVVLHKQGYGQKRLEKWAEDTQKLYNEFTAESRSTDTPHRRDTQKMSNVDTAMIRLLRDLRRDKIDYLKILDLEDIKINGESVETILNKMEERGM